MLAIPLRGRAVVIALWRANIKPHLKWWLITRTCRGKRGILEWQNIETETESCIHLVSRRKRNGVHILVQGRAGEVRAALVQARREKAMRGDLV